MYAAFIAVAYESRSWEMGNWIAAEVRSVAFVRADEAIARVGTIA
jgi:hypothetical protein